MSYQYDLLESGRVPDCLIRWSIRQRLAKLLTKLRGKSEEADHASVMAHIAGLKEMPIAVETKAANDQHYEVPTRFFELCLGANLKYSSGYWIPGMEKIEDSEAEMLRKSCENADLEDGQKVLELGCGWGSLTLWMAKTYPNSQITGVSNSATQRAHILAKAEERGLTNVEIITCDMNAFTPPNAGEYDRVVSVEMFEHMKNYEKLMAGVASWLKPGGKLFVHIFTHRDLAYHFVAESEEDWMAEHFFTGGQMPSDSTLLYFQDDLRIEGHWRIDGTHYEKTSNAWLANMDANREEILPILAETYGEKEVTRWWVRWRVFYMACAELWGYKNGREWIVSHYRFVKG